MSDTSRLTKMEDQISNIRADQSSIKTTLNTLSEAIKVLVDIRGETLHIVKQQERNNGEHDEIFERLRNVETALSNYKIEKKSINDDILNLEANQKWGVITIIGAVIAYAIRKVFFN